MRGPRLAIVPGVYVARGKFGRRRARVTECAAAIHAEQLYESLLRDDSRPFPLPGTVVQGVFTVKDLSIPFKGEVTANYVWRLGRIFLLCPNCKGRCTRLYLPTLTLGGAACRRCLGLTYRSRTRRNYKARVVGGILASLGWTYRDDAQLEASRDAEARARVRFQRWDARKAVLAARLLSSKVVMDSGMGRTSRRATRGGQTDG